MICPIMSRPLATYSLQYPDSPEVRIEWVGCQKEQCRLWVDDIRTTENCVVTGCALEMKCHMNSEGQYRV